MNTPARIDLLSRREALQRAIALLGGAVIAGPALLAACSKAPAPGAEAAKAPLFDASQLALLDDAADTILPDTQTPGARAAQVGAFIALMVTDCYTPAQQAAFKAGLAEIEQKSQAAHGKAFSALAPADRLALLLALEKQQYEAEQAAQAAQPARPRVAHRIGTDERVAPSMRMLKELTLLGYFSSEIGCTQAQRFIEVPGRYDPDVPYHPGDKAWAPMASA